jgi:WD40 repeat protein
LTCGALDSLEKNLAICDEEGLITIHNIHSGGILHTLNKIGTEMTQLLFLNDNTNFWFASVGWEGKVAFVKYPILQKSIYSLPIIIKKSVHTGDIFSIDYCDNCVATGGVDNRVCIWNSLSGTSRSIIEVPKDRPNTFICAIKFIKTKKQTHLFVL